MVASKLPCHKISDLFCKLLTIIFALKIAAIWQKKVHIALLGVNLIAQQTAW